VFYSHLEDEEAAVVAPVVETSGGRLEGRSLDGAELYAGIPYGADTAGPNRFRPPRPAEPWTGVRDATDFGPAAMQIGADAGRDAPPMSEDCLVLNVWTTGHEGRRPVLFWIHGGGFFQGSGHDPITDGAALARSGEVVVVTVNHRLGIFGFLDLEEVDDASAGSGNAGLLDLVAALQWVRENIAAFGGDPDAVHIFGHSGGGAKVSALMSMPAARGLFRSAGIHGGPPFGLSSPDRATRAAHEVLGVVGAAADASGARALRELSSTQVLALQPALAGDRAPVAGAMRFTPVVGRAELPGTPEEYFAVGGSAGIRLIIGTARDEARFAMRGGWGYERADFALTREELVRRVATGLDDPRAAGLLVERYHRVLPDATWGRLLFDILSDQFRIRTLRLAGARIAAGAAETYLYLCELGGTEPTGAFHGVEMPLFFGTPDAADWTESASAHHVADQVSGALVRFAQGGHPDPRGGSWPELASTGRQLVIGDADADAGDDPLAERMAAWEGVLATPRTDPWSTLFLDAPR
jgi:para-nitrobenzyl esterase